MFVLRLAKIITITNKKLRKNPKFDDPSLTMIDDDDDAVTEREKQEKMKMKITRTRFGDHP